ncbi:MAG: hypothetical protein V1644_00675 [Candidatus Micrarchaeota archaeon]
MKFVVLFGMLFASLLLFGCLGSSDPKAALCEKQTDQFDKDSCYFDLVNNGNYSSASEGGEYCRKIENPQFKAACNQLVYFG